ncbi:uncharacterized protein LOC123409185 isoform X1 [Hordeum vulgare subsp. vulgare]|nr:uncharacterized protein LOC123409185 isoform X1 [Hordeum vulgare subsp. vulgare]XP_044958088.1 uncharacterized protein LOC123409185 isoform X1 [Hordeum vulgare subsp. vulgare]
MFRNKVLVRAVPVSVPSSSPAPSPPFLLRQVSFSAAAPPLDLDILCCRLSSRHRLACLPQSPADALVVYQRCQSRAAAEVASEIAAAFTGASVGEEEEVVCSGSLVAKAVECGLRCLMLERGWSFVGESIYVQSTFAATEERTDLCALNVEVRSGLNDDYEFVVSPDAFRFTALKISDVASSSVMETFQHTKEVSLDGCNLQTACAILPTLQEGHVIGFSELPPSGQILDSFTELCSVKHGLEMNYSYHAAVKLTYGASCEKQWLPSPFVLQGPGLQPAPKSVRASKAMSSMRSFIELLKAWNFFGQSQLVIKEQVVVNCTATLPTWDKATSKLAIHTATTENSEDLRLVHPSFMAKDQSLSLDFRTPKPAVFCSSAAKLCSTKVEIAQSLDDAGIGNDTHSIKHSCQSQSVILTSSFKSQITLLKPSFSRSKLADKNKMRCSSEQSDADSSNRSSETCLPKSSLGRFPKASHANPVDSSSAHLLKQVIQDCFVRQPTINQIFFPTPPYLPNFQTSGNPKRKHAEILENSGEGGTVKVHQKDCCEKRNLDTRKSKDSAPNVPQDTTSVLDIQKDVLRTKIKPTKSKSMVVKNEITATTKSKKRPEVVKDELTKKEIEHQKDVAKKVTKAKPVNAKDELTSTTKTKTKPNVDKEELIAKVIDYHKRGELRLLTVADLKCFLNAKKAKVGGSKEVLIQRATELIS